MSDEARDPETAAQAADFIEQAESAPAQEAGAAEQPAAEQGAQAAGAQQAGSEPAAEQGGTSAGYVPPPPAPGVEERPEVAVGAAFVGGLLFARLLARMARRRHRL
jgi:hypothetical protein